MSSINTVPMTQVAAGSTGVANHQALGGSTTSGVLAGGMGNFWDMIMAQFGASEDPAKLAATADKATQSIATANLSETPDMVKQAKPQDHNPLALLQIALSSQTVDAQGNIVLDGETTNATKIERQLELTNTIINHLKNALPENAEKDGILAGVLAKLQAKSDTLQASLSALEGGTISKDTPVKDLPLPILIALGLNPAEITEVSEKIQDMQKKLGREITVEDLIAGVGGLLPATPQNTVVALKTSGDKVVLDAIDENTMPTDDLAAQLNALDVGAGDDIAVDVDAEAAATSAKKDPQAGITNLIGEGDETAQKPEGLPVKAEQPVDQTAKPDNANGHVKKDAASFKENLVNMLNSQNAQQGGMVFPATYSGLEADSAIYQPYGMAATSSMSLGTTAQAANLISSPTVAGQNHPATQLVAATLTKAGKGGEDSTINLRLDPPELGNVAIRLQFSAKDKTVKAVVTAEKPETHLMLQRESTALERALQTAGYDAASQSISFELAQDNGTNRRHGENSDNNNLGGGGKASQDAGGADEIIQSSMTWQVDPSTGRMRYNVLA